MARKLFHFCHNLFAILMKNREISQNTRNSMKLLLKNDTEIKNDPKMQKNKFWMFKSSKNGIFHLKKSFFRFFQKLWNELSLTFSIKYWATFQVMANYYFILVKQNISDHFSKALHFGGMPNCALFIHFSAFGGQKKLPQFFNFFFFKSDPNIWYSRLKTP